MRKSDDESLEEFGLGFAERGAGAPEDAASAAQSGLRDALRDIAQRRAAANASTSKVHRSPYKDSTQLGISCAGTFSRSSFSGAGLPHIHGQIRIWQSFKPTKLLLDERLEATFDNGGGDVVLSADVPDANDLTLVDLSTGLSGLAGGPIAGSVFSINHLGSGVLLPTLQGGRDATASLRVSSTALYRFTPPAGHTFDDLKSLKVKVRMSLLGPSLADDGIRRRA